MINEFSLLDDLFGNTYTGYGTQLNNCSAPATDVIENKDNYTIIMNLPGRTENDIEITTKSGTLTIKSVEKEEDKNTQQKMYLLRERRMFSFNKSFTLPKDASHEDISASLKNGVLTVVVNRKAEEKARSIAVTAA